MGLMAALGLSHSSVDSEEYPRDSASSLDSSAGAGELEKGQEGGLSESSLSPASSYNKAMENVSIEEGRVKITGDEEKAQNNSNSETDSISENLPSDGEGVKLQEVKIPSVSPKPSAMSPTSHLKDREKNSNKSRSNSPSVKFNTQDIIVPPPPHHQPVHTAPAPVPPTVQVLPQQKIAYDQQTTYPSHIQPKLPYDPHQHYPPSKPPHDQPPLNYDFGKPPLGEPPPGFTNIAANFGTQLGPLFPPTQGLPDRGFFHQQKVHVHHA